MTQTYLDPATFSRIVEWRRDLHRNPELSWQETRTARKICEALTELGITFRADVAGTGVVAELPGPAGGPVVALRADIDALPIQEETGLEYASERAGVMHACGHDGHTGMVLGAAALLAREPALPATVRLIFQPAEEVGAGAKAMIEQGALDGVAMIFGAHVDRNYPAGVIVPHEGPVNASADTFRIEVRGRGGHAARPHEGVDAVVIGSAIVGALQTVVSRELDPARPAVLTVGRFAGGSASNVIAATAVLEGTIRAQTPEVREHLMNALSRIAESVARAHRAEVAITIDAGTPPVINSPEMAALARGAAAAVVGEENLASLLTANMGGEDFAYYLERVPGCFVRMGSGVPGRSHPAHSSRFELDEDVLAVGARYFAQVAQDAGRRLRNA